jgi:glutamate decarboxylase
VWDFRLARVQSINASGHKYGLVYPGIGWVVWRDDDALPEDLIFKVDYLGGEMPTFALNFSRPGAQIVAQYYVLLRLGTEGFTRVQGATRETAMRLASELERLGPFELLSHGDELPVFAFRLRDEVEGYTVYDVSEQLRRFGWIVPAYRMPKAIEDMAVLRVCVRGGFGRELSDHLVADLRRTIDQLEKRGGGAPEDSSFHH